MYAQMFIATLFMITKGGRNPDVYQLISKQKPYTHTTVYYPALKRNEVLTHVTICMQLENIMLIERNYAQMVMPDTSGNGE